MNIECFHGITLTSDAVIAWRSGNLGPTAWVVVISNRVVNHNPFCKFSGHSSISSSPSKLQCHPVQGNEGHQLAILDFYILPAPY
jgi:hypothetical protein